MTGWLTIGEFANRAGLTARALRIYEELGLIQSVHRGENGYRYYQESQLELVAKIKQFKSMGFSLREIKALFLSNPDLGSDDIQTLFSKRLAAIELQASELQLQKLGVLEILMKAQHGDVPFETTERSNLMSKIEHEFPFLSVRDFVTFPTQRRAIYVGRNFSKASIQQALDNYNGTVVIATQKFIEMNDRPDPEQVFEVGCLCSILEMTENEDGTIKIIVEAKAKWHIIDLVDRDKARFCRGIEIPLTTNSNLSPNTKATLTSKIVKLVPHSVESLQTAIGGSEFIARAMLALGSQTAALKARRGSFLIDSLSSEETKNINTTQARLQEILAENDPEAIAQKILNLVPQEP